MCAVFVYRLLIICLPGLIWRPFFPVDYRPSYIVLRFFLDFLDVVFIVRKFHVYGAPKEGVICLAFLNSTKALEFWD